MNVFVETTKNKLFKKNKITLILVSFITAIIFAELLGYIYTIKKYKVTPHKLGKYQLEVDKEYITDHPYLPYLIKMRKNPWIQINSYYIRGPEPEFPKKRIRILTYGGSTTFDYAHKIKETWPGYLQEYLGLKYEVINAAHSGATTADNLIKLELMHSYLEPDYILVYHGTNDLYFSLRNGKNFRTDYSHSRRHVVPIPYPFFLKLPQWLSYSSIFTITQGYLIGYRGQGLHPRYTFPDQVLDFNSRDKGYKTFKTNLMFINLIAEHINSTVILGTFQYYKIGMERKWLWCDRICRDQWEEGINKQNEIIRLLSKGNDNILLAEVAESFVPSDNTMTDHCHLTSLGNQYIAKAFFKTIKKDYSSSNSVK